MCVKEKERKTRGKALRVFSSLVFSSVFSPSPRSVVVVVVVVDPFRYRSLPPFDVGLVLTQTECSSAVIVADVLSCALLCV